VEYHKEKLMSLPPIPPPLQHLATRPFSFYPAIINIEHNEWLFRRASWSEIQVVNSRTGLELWIPRRFLGEISRIEDPVVIVGLVKELEYKSGAVWPYQRRVIEMPVAVGDTARPAPAPRPEPAPVVGIRLESSTDSRITRLVIGTVTVGVVISLVALTVYRESTARPKIHYATKDQSYLELTPRDDYYSVVHKLGAPAEDRWRSESGEIQYRGLWYPQRAYVVILMGTERKGATYIGTLDANWNPVHWVQFRTGGTTRSMLRGLPRF
jgi:hypothetical protein